MIGRLIEQLPNDRKLALLLITFYGEELNKNKKYRSYMLDTLQGNTPLQYERTMTILNSIFSKNINEQGNLILRSNTNITSIDEAIRLMEKDIYSQLINTPTQKEITQDSTTKRKVYLLDFDKHRLSTYKQGVEFYTTNYPVGLHTKVEPMVKEDFEIKYVLVDNWESDIAHRTISEKTLKN